MSTWVRVASRSWRSLGIAPRDSQRRQTLFLVLLALQLSGNHNMLGSPTLKPEEPSLVASEDTTWSTFTGRTRRKHSRFSCRAHKELFTT